MAGPPTAIRATTNRPPPVSAGFVPREPRCWRALSRRRPFPTEEWWATTRLPGSSTTPGGAAVRGRGGGVPGGERQAGRGTPLAPRSPPMFTSDRRRVGRSTWPPSLAFGIARRPKKDATRTTLPRWQCATRARPCPPVWSWLGASPRSSSLGGARSARLRHVVRYRHCRLCHGHVLTAVIGHKASWPGHSDEARGSRAQVGTQRRALAGAAQ
jgi:hypothetical protein